MEPDQIKIAAERYDRCIRDTLNRLLEREPLRGSFLNTRVNPITGLDYDHRSG